MKIPRKIRPPGNTWKKERNPLILIDLTRGTCLRFSLFFNVREVWEGGDPYFSNVKCIGKIISANWPGKWPYPVNRPWGVRKYCPQIYRTYRSGVTGTFPDFPGILQTCPNLTGLGPLPTKSTLGSPNMRAEFFTEVRISGDPLPRSFTRIFRIFPEIFYLIY